MTLLHQREEIMFRVLVVCVFGVTNVSMQTRVSSATEPFGTFESAGYPNTSTVNDAWEIIVDPNHQILLQFFNVSLNETSSCNIDVIKVFDGNRTQNVLVDTFCWKENAKLTSAAYISTSNQFYIRLTTMHGYSRQGFKAHYVAVKLEHNESSSELTSPGYPTTGEVNEAWRIKVEEDRSIRLEFKNFNLYEYHPCSDDFVELYDGVCNPYTLRGKWCFNDLSKFNQTIYTSTRNVFYLRLRTKHNHNRSGFKANYNSTLKKRGTSSDINSLHCISTTSATPFDTGIPTQVTLSNTTDVSSNTSFTNLSTSSRATKIVASGSTSTTPVHTESKLNGMFQSTAMAKSSVADPIIYIVPPSVLLIACILVGLFCCYFKLKRGKRQDSPHIEVQDLKTNNFIQNVNGKDTFASKRETNSGADPPLQNVFCGDVDSVPNDETPYNDIKNIKEDENVASSLSDHRNVSENYSPMKTVNGDEKTTITNQTENLLTKYSHDQTRATLPYSHVDRNAPNEEDKVCDVLYSVPNKKQTDELRLVPNVAYESFDETKKENKSYTMVDEVPYNLPCKKKRDSECMTINEAYQSYDSDEDGDKRRMDPTYYYLDENDKEKIGQSEELVYDSV